MSDSERMWEFKEHWSATFESNKRKNNITKLLRQRTESKNVSKSFLKNGTLNLQCENGWRFALHTSVREHFNEKYH